MTTTMRRLVCLGTTALLGAGAIVAFGAGIAEAQVTSPGNGAVLRGDATLTDTGGYDDSTLNHCNGNTYTTIQLVNSGGTVVHQSTRGGDNGAYSVTIRTEDYPNGSYTVRGIDGIGKNSGFLGFGCKTSTTTSQVSVTIANQVAIAYPGPFSAPQNTTLPVSATLTDPNLDSAPVANRTVAFQVAPGPVVTAVTNGAGIASAVLPVVGPPRAANLTVSFAGDAFYSAASRSFAFTVAKDATATTVASVQNPTVHGEPAQFTAHVHATQGGGTPTGSVQFVVDGDDYGAPAPLSAGTATTAPDPTLATGDHTVSARYLGDADYLASASAQITHTVGRAQTTTSLYAAPNPTVYGQSVTFTATVSVLAPGAGTPTGAVRFDVDGQPYGTAVPLTGDTASVTISALRAGNHTVVATYDGDPDFAASASAQLTQGVGMAATSVSATSSSSPSVTGEQVTFTAVVAAVGPGAGTPTGTVQFTVDGEPLGGPVALTDGGATSPAIALRPGSHPVVAAYSGDGDFSGSSQSFAQAVDPAQTTTTVTSSVDPSVFGQPVTFSAAVAAVAPGGGTPSGTVQFLVDGTPVGVPVALVDGQGDSAPVADLAPGDHAVTAVFTGDDGAYVPSTSAPYTQQVNRAQTRTTLTSSAEPAVFGQPVTFTAAVAPVAPGAGSPTGTVTFLDGTTVLGTVPVGPGTGERASLTTSALVVAQHAIQAQYSGDDNFLAGSDALTQTVLRGQTSTVLTSSANPAQSGQPITFSARVSPVAPAAGTPTGTVTFTVNGAPLGSPAPVVDGVATSTSFASLSPGTYKIGATYGGDRNFVTSSAVLDQGTGQEVVKGATAMTFSSSPNPSAYGQTVTFTSVVSAVAPATGRPSGVVQFFDGDVLLGSVSLVPGAPGSATATFPFATLAPGAHSVRSVYVGNFNFTGQSASLSQGVGLIPTVTGVTAAPNPSVFGQSVTFTATVAADPDTAGTPSGTVTFRDGTTVLGTAALESVQGKQQATLTVPSLHAGARAITAGYDGSGDFAASTSPVFTQNVARAASGLVADTLVTVTQENGAQANQGRIGATLTGLDGAPLVGETVSFSATYPATGAVDQICTAVTDTAGYAHCDVTQLLPELLLYNGYDAAFAGNADYLPATAHGRTG